MADPVKNYRYVGTSKNIEDQNFNKEYYDELRANRNYQDAYDYAMQFKLNDPVAEDERRNKLKTMLRRGHVVETVYKNADETFYPAIDFRMNVKQPGGLERLQNNEYAENFIAYKDALGDNADRLQIVFEPVQQKGIFGIDWMKKDNVGASIENLYENTGYNKQYLEANGVNVRLKDGKTYLEFDKSNDLANTILLNLPHDTRFSPMINGLDEEGNVKSDYLVRGGGGDMSWWNTTHGTAIVSRMQQLYKDAEKLENLSYQAGSAKIKQVSSQVFPLLYEEAKNLEDDLAEGKIKDGSFNSRIKRENKKLLDGLAFINPADYEFQTTYFNDNDNPVNTLVENQEDKQKLMDRYKGTKQSDIKYGIVIAGDKVGLVVQLPQILDKDKKVKEEAVDFTIFGDDIEQQLNRQINTDPGMQAYREINDMQDLGYSYKDHTGNSYTYDGLGGWIMNGTTKVQQDFVRKQIHKDIAAQDIGRDLALNNVSVNGTLVSPERYANQVMVASFMIANDANKEGDIIEALKVIYGNSIDYTDANAITRAIFALKGAGNRVADEYEDVIIDPRTYNKFNDIYETCYNLLEVGHRYINK